ITTFADLTLGAMLRLYAIPDDMDALDRQVAILAVLSDCTEDEILALPLAEYSRRVAASRFLDRDLPQRLPQRSYKCGPFTLEPVRDFKKITTAQFVDFKTFTDQAGGDESRLSELTPAMLSCMLTPEGRDYCDGYDPIDVQTAIRDHLRADDAVALSAFFLARWMRLSRRILASSRRIARRNKMKGTLDKIRELTRSRKALTSTRPAGGGSR
ncbi:MAG: hypothetical protein II265_03995, partial [Clostridia bacterium]|nr:hypothetical protein [Clostridia bacterium]